MVELFKMMVFICSCFLVLTIAHNQSGCLKYWLQLLHDLFIFINWYIYLWIQCKLFGRLFFSRNCVLSIFRSDLYAIAESIHPNAYWKLGKNLGYTGEKLEQWKREHNESILQATFSMLCDRLTNMSATQWMNTLITACDQCGLKKMSLHLREGNVSPPTPQQK